MADFPEWTECRECGPHRVLTDPEQQCRCKCHGKLEWLLWLCETVLGPEDRCAVECGTIKSINQAREEASDIDEFAGGTERGASS